MKIWLGMPPGTDHTRTDGFKNCCFGGSDWARPYKARWVRGGCLLTSARKPHKGLQHNGIDADSNSNLLKRDRNIALHFELFDKVLKPFGIMQKDREIVKKCWNWKPFRNEKRDWGLYGHVEVWHPEAVSSKVDHKCDQQPYKSIQNAASGLDF